MNQIICTSNCDLDKVSIPNSNKKHFFQVQFFALLFIVVFAFSYYGYSRYDLKQKENFSKEIMEHLKITRLYASNSDYHATSLQNQIYFYEGNAFSVIGSIEIEKLNIDYPILSDLNQDLLKVAPCRFYGPMPNEMRKSLYCWT